MTRTIATLGLSALLILGARATADEPASSGGPLKPADLVGGYTIVSGEQNGQPEPEAKIKGTTVRFTEEAIVVLTPDKKEAYAATFTLDADHSPCRITMTSKLAAREDVVSHGLIEKRGETVRLIYALPGGKTPSEFKTKELQNMFVMKNMNP